MEQQKPKKLTWLIVILAVIALALIAFIVWDKFIKKTDTTAPTTTESTPATTDQTANPGSTSSTDSTVAPVTPPATTTPVTPETDNIAAVNKVATSFLNAWSQRSLDTAKPYMTTAYYSSTDQGSFAGVSSPSRGRFVINTTTAVTAGQKYTVKVTAYQNLGGEEIGSAQVTLDIVKSGTAFLVNSLAEGALVQN